MISLTIDVIIRQNSFIQSQHVVQHFSDLVLERFCPFLRLPTMASVRNFAVGFFRRFKARSWVIILPIICRLTPTRFPIISWVIGLSMSVRRFTFLMTSRVRTVFVLRLFSHGSISVQMVEFQTIFSPKADELTVQKRRFSGPKALSSRRVPTCSGFLGRKFVLSLPQALDESFLSRSRFAKYSYIEKSALFKW